MPGPPRRTPQQRARRAHLADAAAGIAPDWYPVIVQEPDAAQPTPEDHEAER